MKPNNFPVRLTLDGTEEIYTQTNDVSEKFTLDAVKSFIGGGLEGTRYIVVTANGTPQENAAELQAAYDTLKTMSPSADNRLTLIAVPGEYQFTSTFVMDTEFIDFVSLTGNRDVIFDLEGIVDPFSYDTDTFDILDISECLLIDTDNVYVKGIKGKFYLSPNWDVYWGNGENYILPIQISDNLPNIIIENCEGGAFSFGGDYTYATPITVSGTFVDCIGLEESFATFQSISTGTFINCTGSDSSWSGTCNGIYKNCQTNASFGAFGGGFYSANGTFYNCVSPNCRSFGASLASGIFYNCVGGSSGGSGSFGGNGTLTGQLYYCRLTSGTFQTVSGSGRTYYCIDGNGNTNNQ